MGDPTELFEIIMNLCTNAYHAMEESGGRLTVTFTEAEINEPDQKYLNLAPGRYCILSVSDTGQGIPKNIVDQIFEPYFTTKKIGKGSGLGLAVIHGIVEDYGGAINVESELGKGTTFYIYLPAAKREKLEIQDLKKTVLSSGNEHVLFVDDEEAIVNIGVLYLEKLGYTVTGKTSSQDAFQTFQKHSHVFDIVITDMTMPGMMGTKLIQKIKEIRPDIPIILCTGFSDLIDDKKSKALGIEGFIRKPILRDVLSQKIRDILDN